MKYPETWPQLWFNAPEFVPARETEKFYQNLLYFHLKANTQGTLIVVREDQTNAGRTDLTLNAMQSTLAFVMEMKVLRSCFYHSLGKPWRKWSKKQNEDWAHEGVDQVIDYRTAKHAREAFLLLYDMRKKHEVIQSVKDRCDTEQVQLRKYDIFNESARNIRKGKKPKPKRPKTR